MAALALALQIFSAVVWVGGMFAIYVCLRPALVTLEPPQRLRLMRVTFQKFFPWVWADTLEGEIQHEAVGIHHADRWNGGVVARSACAAARADAPHRRADCPIPRTIGKDS